MSFTTTLMSASPLLISMISGLELPAWVGLNAWCPAACPEMGAARAADICQSAQHWILAFAVQLQVLFFLDADAYHVGARPGGIHESLPFIGLETHFAVDEHFLGWPAAFLV